MRALVLADTHLKADLDPLPPAVWDAVEDADVILHAGDVVTGDLLGALRRLRPVHAVLGNNDRALVGALPADRYRLLIDWILAGEPGGVIPLAAEAAAAGRSAVERA